MIVLAQQPAASPPATRYRNAAVWWAALGEVPMERIVFDPLPGTATEADVLRLDDHEDRICEFVDGTLVQKPGGYEESVIAALIAYLLISFVRPRRLGYVSGAAGMMRILPTRIRIPDVAFLGFASLAGGKLPPGRVPRISPDLAVEVLSHGNTRKEMNLKLVEYFAAGTRLVWHVDPPTRTIEVFTSPENPRPLTMADRIDGGNVLPGFDVAVAEIFDIDMPGELSS